jgi:hypothetical protein
MITVTFKGSDITKVSLINSGKNVELTSVVIDGMVSVTLEIEKAHLEKSHLSIGSNDGWVACTGTYVLYLKGYVV